MKITPVLLTMLALAAITPSSAQDAKPAATLNRSIADGPFQPTAESLATYKVPEWFRDAKFGIWSHWGPQAVPRMGDWYARRLYLGPGHVDRRTGQIVNEPGPEYRYHLEHYGHPSEFGYKDIIPLWKAERWDPDALMALYKRAGARYFVSMGVHHDNFALWNSPLHRWNSVNMGPKKDVVGLWQAAAKKHGLRFGVSEHLAASYSWFQSAHGADAAGPKAGVPYDGNDARFEDLYHSKISPFDFNWMSSDPKFHQNWFARIRELVDACHPDLLYSDSKLPFEDAGGPRKIKYSNKEVGMQLLAHYYNSSAALNKGLNDAVYTCKEKADGRWVQDLERTVMTGIQPEPWQTDTSIGDWYYRTGQKYKSSADIIHLLADIVSKNGNLLINVVQTPEGDLEPDVIAIVEEVGAWMRVNGEAIHATRPWKVFGEDAQDQAPARPGNVRGDTSKYTDKNLRFTASKDGRTLYVIALGWPAEGNVTVKSLAKGSTLFAGEVGPVRLLGGPDSLVAAREADGLHVRLPSQKPCASAFALAITLR